MTESEWQAIQAESQVRNQRFWYALWEANPHLPPLTKVRVPGNGSPAYSLDVPPVGSGVHECQLTLTISVQLPDRWIGDD